MTESPEEIISNIILIIRNALTDKTEKIITKILKQEESIKKTATKPKKMNCKNPK